MKKNIESLRTEIDKIDEQIFSLLQARLKIVEKVGHLKKSEEKKPIIRPGREASMLQKFYNKAKKSGYSAKTSLAFANLWRSIIILGVNYEDEIEILVKSVAERQIAKDYLGKFADIKIKKSDKEIIKQLNECSQSISVLDAKKAYTTEPWWFTISKTPQIKIIAKLPLMEVSSKENIYALANITPEPTGNDKFVYVITGKMPCSISDEAKIISKYKTHTLIELDEFYNDFEKPIDAKYLGCYSFLAV